MANSFQFTREIRLSLTHRKKQKKTNRTKCHAGHIAHGWIRLFFVFFVSNRSGLVRKSDASFWYPLRPPRTSALEQLPSPDRHYSSNPSGGSILMRRSSR